MAQINLPARYPKDADALRYYRALSRSLDALPARRRRRARRAAAVFARGHPDRRAPARPAAVAGAVGGALHRGEPVVFRDHGHSARRRAQLHRRRRRREGGAGRSSSRRSSRERCFPRRSRSASTWRSVSPATMTRIRRRRSRSSVSSATFARDSLTRDIKPAMYGTLGRMPVAIVGVVARSSTPAVLLPALRQSILAVDPDLPPTLISPMESLLDEVDPHRAHADGAARPVRRHRAASRHHRHLRRHVVLGDAATPRDRHSRRCWCARRSDRRARARREPASWRRSASASAWRRRWRRRG